MKRNISSCILLAAALVLPAAVRAAGDYRADAIAMLKRDFQARGIATTDRLSEDGLQAVCNQTANQPPKTLAELLQQDQLAAVQYPADGKLIGNWREGEKIAQSGRGFTWTDQPGLAVGGNCYNCHQLSPAELSYGTLGPTLRSFGRRRGNTAETQQYVYAKIYNAKAYKLCSAMPRFGHIGALSVAQIKDLVALILDPESPVNQ